MMLFSWLVFPRGAAAIHEVFFFLPPFSSNLPRICNKLQPFRNSTEFLSGNVLSLSFFLTAGAVPSQAYFVASLSLFFWPRGTGHPVVWTFFRGKLQVVYTEAQISPSFCCSVCVFCIALPFLVKTFTGNAKQKPLFFAKCRHLNENAAIHFGQTLSL